MILPGISGAFVLLILGKYEFITGTLKSPFVPENLLVILVFCGGCAAGLAGFSRVLNYLLRRFHNLTLALLTGLMAGSMQKIWPWKEALETRLIGGEPRVLRTRNLMPQGLDTELLTAVSLAVAGFVLVMVIERLSREKT